MKLRHLISLLALALTGGMSPAYGQGVTPEAFEAMIRPQLETARADFRSKRQVWVGGKICDSISSTSPVAKGPVQLPGANGQVFKFMKYQEKTDYCGRIIEENFIAAIFPDRPPLVSYIVAGNTAADPVLQRDVARTLFSTVPVLMNERKIQCEFPQIITTQTNFFERLEALVAEKKLTPGMIAQGALSKETIVWKEEWTVGLCGTEEIIAFDFAETPGAGVNFSAKLPRPKQQ